MAGNNLEDPTKLLQVIAQVNRSMAAIAGACRGKVEVTAVARGVDVMTYNDFVSWYAYVDVELRDGPPVSWLFNVEATLASWKINRSILKGSKDGQQVIVDFPDVSCTSPQDLSVVLPKLADEMVGSVETFKF